MWPGDTHFCAQRSKAMDADVGIAVQLSRSAESAPAGLAERSLKTQQHAGRPPKRTPRPSPVDMLGAGTSSRSAVCGVRTIGRSIPGAP
jgi:hypothetical protein